jgi:hypothetical protein
MSAGAMSPIAKVRVCNCMRGNNKMVNVATSNAVIPISRQAIFIPPDFDMVTTPSFVNSGRTPRSGRARPLRSRSIGRHSPSVALTTTLNPWLKGLIGANDLLDQFVADDVPLGKVYEANTLDTAQDVLHLD